MEVIQFNYKKPTQKFSPGHRVTIINGAFGALGVKAIVVGVRTSPFNGEQEVSIETVINPVQKWTVWASYLRKD